jgi:transcription factor-like protein
MRSSKTSIAWTLATTALIMCQTHGMHRIQSMKHDNSIVRNQKIWTFWMLYSIEKGLSLRLGRPSTVQDYDITIPIPEVDPFSSGPFVYVAIRWIKLSQVQGKIYKRLYSPAGLADTVGVRSRWVAALVSEIQLLRATTRDQEVCSRCGWGWLVPDD